MACLIVLIQSKGFLTLILFTKALDSYSMDRMCDNFVNLLTWVYIVISTSYFTDTNCIPSIGVEVGGGGRECSPPPGYNASKLCFFRIWCQ